jgi:hypothetical protein
MARASARAVAYSHSRIEAWSEFVAGHHKKAPGGIARWERGDLRVDRPTNFSFVISSPHRICYLRPALEALK